MSANTSRTNSFLSILPTGFGCASSAATILSLTLSASTLQFCVFFIGETPFDVPLAFAWVYACAEGAVAVTAGAAEMPLTYLPALPSVAFAVVGVLIISRPEVDVVPNVLLSFCEARGDGDAGGPCCNVLNDLELELTESTTFDGGTSQLSSISRLAIASLSFLLFLFPFPFSFSEKGLLVPFTYLWPLTDVSASLRPLYFRCKALLNASGSLSTLVSSKLNSTISPSSSSSSRSE